MAQLSKIIFGGLQPALEVDVLPKSFQEPDDSFLRAEIKIKLK